MKLCDIRQLEGGHWSLVTALLLWKGGFNNIIMSQFLTINKLSGHVFVNQGVFVVKVIINFNM